MPVVFPRFPSTLVFLQIQEIFCTFLLNTFPCWMVKDLVKCLRRIDSVWDLIHWDRSKSPPPHNKAK